MTSDDKARIDFDIPIFLAESESIDLADALEVFRELQLRNIRVVRDGLTALQEDEDAQYALIFISGSLAKINPMKLIAAFRASGANLETPIIYTYRKKEKSLLDEAERVGTTTSLRKPWDAKELRELVENVLQGFIVSKAEQKERSEQLLEPMLKAVAQARQMLSDGAFSGAEDACEEGILELFCCLVEVNLIQGNGEFVDKLIREADRLEIKVRDKLRARSGEFVKHGNVYLRQKRYAQAKFEFEIVISLSPDVFQAHAGYGEALHGLGEDDEEAIRSFERGLKIGVSHSDLPACVRIATIARQMNRFKLAHQALNLAVRCDPRFAEGHYTKALVYMAEKKFGDALNCLTKSLTIDPMFSEARMTKRKLEEWIKAAHERKQKGNEGKKKVNERKQKASSK